VNRVTAKGLHVSEAADEWSSARARRVELNIFRMRVTFLE